MAVASCPASVVRLGDSVAPQSLMDVAGTTLVYIIEHASREQARANWAAFSKDPDWQKAKAESEVNGRIVAKAESVFLTATDYSPLK